jgi:adenine-specific DNA-methyltransferase
VQIGDENVHRVRAMLDEVFGDHNFCAQIAFKKTGASTDDLLPSRTDHLLWCCKSRDLVKYRSAL